MEDYASITPTVVTAPKAPHYKKTYYPLPAHVRKRALLQTQQGYEWTFTVGCSMIPSEIDRIVNAFFNAAEYSQTLSTSSVLADPSAIPCYVSKIIQNIARTYVTLSCTSPTGVNTSRLDTFLRAGSTLPLECRDRITVARNQPIRVKAVTTQSTPGSDRWHLDRTDQRALPLSHAYTYAYNGTGVIVNIVDTGVWCAHSELVGHCESGGNFVQDDHDVDGNGHGSHCAGICCGLTNGPARGALVKSRRVLDDDGYGSFSNVMDALMMIEDEFLADPTQMHIVSMSLSGPVYTPVNELVNVLALVHGIPVIVAAGNAGANTNLYSPGSASGSIPVAASDIGDSMPSWSNRGGNTKIAAPGVSIRSVLTGTTSSYTVKSGTSMSTPLTAGVVAVMTQYMYELDNSSIPFGPDTTTAVIAMASQHRVNGYPLLFSSIGLSDIPQLPATPPQVPSSASGLPKPLNGLPHQPLSYLRSSAERFMMPVFLWFASSPLLLLFAFTCL